MVANDPSPQRALHHDPGRFRALLTFDPIEDDKGNRELLMAAATLLKELESDDLKDKPLKVLVAVAPELLAAHSAYEKLDAERLDIPPNDRAQAKVLVQIAGETEDDRTYARRLVKRHLSPVARKTLELHGGRHTLSREAFGYRDGFVDQRPQIPVSPTMPGVSWLLFRNCVQDVDGFYAKLDEAAQDAIIGRKRDPMGADEPPVPNSHIDVSKKLNREGAPQGRLLRRSFSYGDYDVEGLAFLAVAAHPKHLADALTGFAGEKLKDFVALKEGGTFIVPPSADWLAQREKLPDGLRANRPRPEQPFFPSNPLLLYEMTPTSLEFFLKVFHAHKDNFDEDGALRPDLKLLGKALAKLLYGGRIPTGSLLFQLLEHLFVSDTSEKADNGDPMLPADRPLQDTLAKLAHQRETYERQEQAKRDRRDSGTVQAGLAPVSRRTFDSSAAALRDRAVQGYLAHPDALVGATGGGSILGRTLGELVAQIIVEDRENMRARTAVEKAEIDTIIKLCEKAAAEARALNRRAGKYMTFIC
jgi:deferrochelatase/peroxidase EfeB